jgi:hypothetical protein
VFGFFNRLPISLERFVIDQLQQFAATVGEHLAYRREQEYVQALRSCSGLTGYADALLALLPPVEHLLCVTGKERLGLKLQCEDSFFAGYRPLRGESLDTAFKDPSNRLINLAENEARVQTYVKMLPDNDALSPIFTLMRVKPWLSRLTCPMPDAAQPLTRTELGELLHGLRRQVKEARGAIAACKKLFLIDHVLRNYDQGEVTLSNRRARDYAGTVLGKSIAGYHIAGKAAAKFEADIHKMLPNRFTFELVSSHSIRIRWNRQMDRRGMSREPELASR